MSPLDTLAKTFVPDHIKTRLRELRWPIGWVNALPGTSQVYGPARRWVRASEYFRWNPGHLHPVLAAQPMPAPNVVRCGPIPERFFARIKTDVPAGCLYELPDARIIGPDGWIIGARDSYLRDASFWAYPDEHMDLKEHYMLIPSRTRRTRRLGGRTLSLASDFAIGGFGHFLHDSLTRLLLVERAGVNPAEFDWIYWPHPDTGAVKQLVQATGIPENKILNWDGVHNLECESLTATSFPGRPGHIAPAYADFLRRRFARLPLQRNRKLYLSRKGFRRNFRNASEVDAVIAKFGYEVCFPHSDPDVFQKCAEATHVIAIEGANFFNAFACRPGTNALIVLPDAGPTLPYTMTLGLSAGLNVFLLSAESLDQPHIDPGIAEIYLDPAHLTTALQQMETCR